MTFLIICNAHGVRLVLRLAQSGDMDTRKAAACEIVRLRTVLQIIRDYYGGCGYIGGMAEDALAENVAGQTPAAHKETV